MTGPYHVAPHPSMPDRLLVEDDAGHAVRRRGGRALAWFAERQVAEDHAARLNRRAAAAERSRARKHPSQQEA